jgi:CRISPR/Cas system-associated exonuclease Cas4 (RecB family)
VESKFEAALFDYLESEGIRDEPHVSNFVHDCQRKGYWDWKNGQRLAALDDEALVNELNMDEKTLLTFVLGKKMHELSMSNLHEKELHYRGTTGTSDEIMVLATNEDIVIVDKKTTTTYGMPKTMPKEQHQAQISYYAVMYALEQGDLAFEKKYWGAVLYIDVESKKVMAMPWQIDVAKAKAEFDAKIDQFEQAEKTGVPPPSVYSWLCGFCAHYRACRKLDAAMLGKENV